MQPYSRWVGFAWLAVGIVLYLYTHRKNKTTIPTVADDEKTLQS
jgi:hypothetical protein